MRPAARLSCLVTLGLATVLALAPARARAADMRVAVMEFTSATKDADLASLGKGLQSMVTTDLANVQAIKVVERERLKDVQGELKLSHGQGFDKATAAKIGKLVGATHLFVGSYTVVGERMRLDGRLITIASGTVVLAEQIAGDKALFFELEQQLVQKVIALLGVKVQPKEKAALARAHTADFQAFRKFSDGLQAFDDGRVEAAIKALNEATAIDKDFKLATLTLQEYEQLAAQVRAKADAAGNVEDEVSRLERNKAIASGVAVLKKLWPILDTKGNAPDVKLRRVAAACALSDAYRSELGYRNRGPVTGEDLVAAGFDQFMRERTADALFARAWAEAPDVFPRLPPLCIGLHMVSADNPRPIDELLGYHIADAQKLTKSADILFSYMANNATVDKAAAYLHLDPPGQVRLWEKLYELGKAFPGIRDEDRAEFEEHIALLRRRAGDLDGSTQMFAAASHHTKGSYQLKKYAEEIDKNKQLKIQLDGAPPIVRELYLLGREISDHERKTLNDPDTQRRLNDTLWREREVPEGRGGHSLVIINELPLWRMTDQEFGVLIRTGPRTTDLRASDLRYEGALHSSGRDDKPPRKPMMFASGMRGRKLTFRLTIDQSLPPADWPRWSKAPPAGGGEVGVLFGLNRLVGFGGIKQGVPAITIGYALTVADGRARLAQILRDGEYNIELRRLGEAALPGRAGKQSMEVTVDPGTVTVSLDGKRVSLPWKPEGDTAEGFAGFVFAGLGYAVIEKPSITVR
jgi:TolB-like protein